MRKARKQSDYKFRKSNRAEDLELARPLLETEVSLIEHPVSLEFPQVRGAGALGPIPLPIFSGPVPFGGVGSNCGGWWSGCWGMSPPVNPQNLLHPFPYARWYQLKAKLLPKCVCDQECTSTDTDGLASSYGWAYLALEELAYIKAWILTWHIEYRETRTVVDVSFQGPSRYLNCSAPTKFTALNRLPQESQCYALGSRIITCEDKNQLLNSQWYIQVSTTLSTCELRGPIIPVPTNVRESRVLNFFTLIREFVARRVRQ